MYVKRDMCYVSPMKDTALRNAEQLGMAIRLKRKESGLSQTALAERLGVRNLTPT